MHSSQTRRTACTSRKMASACCADAGVQPLQRVQHAAEPGPHFLCGSAGRISRTRVAGAGWGGVLRKGGNVSFLAAPSLAQQERQLHCSLWLTVTSRGIEKVKGYRPLAKMLEVLLEGALHALSAAAAAALVDAGIDGWQLSRSATLSQQHTRQQPTLASPKLCPSTPNSLLMFQTTNLPCAAGPGADR